MGGGKYESVCKACGKLEGLGHASLGSFEFAPFIRRNLMESGTVFTQTYFTIYCVIKASILNGHNTAEV